MLIPNKEIPMRRTSKINNSHLHFAKIDKSAQTTAAWLGSIGVHLIIIDCYWGWLFICSVPCCLLNPFFAQSVVLRMNGNIENEIGVTHDWDWGNKTRIGDELEWNGASLKTQLIWNGWIVIGIPAVSHWRLSLPLVPLLLSLPPTFMLRDNCVCLGSCLREGNPTSSSHKISPKGKPNRQPTTAINVVRW